MRRSGDGIYADITNHGAGKIFMQRVYLHIITERGRGFGYFLETEDDAEKALEPGEKRRYRGEAIPGDVVQYVSIQRVREACIVADSSKVQIARFCFDTSWYELFDYERHLDKDLNLDQERAYEFFDFATDGINTFNLQ